MDKKKLLECIHFFNKLIIKEEDVTTNEEKENGQLVVIATYKFENNTYTTNKLFYKNINKQRDVKNRDGVVIFFGEPVFWLDIDVHEWPDGSGTKLESSVIPDMVNDGDFEFENFLKTIANDNKSGFEQELTWEGRSAQYSINLENNNHWHDIINLIKAVINRKGNPVDKKYFSRLVFEWDDNSGARTSLHPNFGSRALIGSLYSNIKSIQKKLEMKNMQSLLEYKKQIILQGPPGTGKTKLAKEIALDLIPLTDDMVVDLLTKGLKINTVKGKTTYIILDIDIPKKQVKLLREKETDNIITFSNILNSFKEKRWFNEVDSNDDRMAVAVAKYLYDNILENSSQYKLIQFHPSYTYEDFVRGIVAESKGEKIEYKNVNKILGKFADEAKKNWDDSNKDSSNISKENRTKEYFELFTDHVNEQITEGRILQLTPSVKLTEVDEDAFRYKGNDGWSTLGNRMLFKDIIQAFLDGNKVRQDIKKNKNLSGLAIQHASYFVRVLNMFQEYLVSNNLIFEHLRIEKVALKNYVLIIDEINRANLSSVLGELIYALEYRGEAVESMYEVDGRNELVLPPNLFIIGTMNTADRSVGHIDYAIRRRFAFVDILPEDLSNEPNIQFHKALFDQVSALFDTNLSAEFEKTAMQLGHSYFIDKTKDGGSMDIRLEYEIKPILREYIKDGVLIGEEIKDKIEKLAV